MVERILYGLAVAQGALLFALIFASAVTDLLHRRIHNSACVAAIVLGLLLSYMRGGLDGGPVSLFTSLLACGIGFGVFFLFYLLGGLGAGDVKLMAGVGALCASWKFVLWTIANAAFAGVPLAVGILLWRGQLREGLGRSLRGL